MDADIFSALAASRRSVRDFRPDPVAPEVLEAILNDARTAASWSNTRPYMLAIATGEQAERIKAAYVAEFDASLKAQHKDPVAMAKMVAKRQLPDGDFPVTAKYPEDLRPASVEVGVGLYSHLGIQRGDTQARDDQNRRNFVAFGAPVVGFVFIHKDFQPFSAHDAGIMLATLMLSAKARGLDTCGLGSLAIWRRPVDAEWDIPKHYGLMTGFALGYASDDHVNRFEATRPPLRMVSPKAQGN
ncbi:nitroreductase [Schaalia suimastitidis]|uniref:nitroreductase n=1 Tax=Schaalia suimastitidis TaxID=121163 RepID=UPI00042356AE|nr:nitroreductase [Schaalia suimastitidis]